MLIHQTNTHSSLSLPSHARALGVERREKATFIEIEKREREMADKNMRGLSGMKTSLEMC